jgi:hypothetical protein
MLRRLRHEGGEDGGRGRRLERRGPREHLVCDDSRREQVGTVVRGGIGAGLLRSHVLGRTERHPDGGDPSKTGRFGERLGDAEVGHEGMAFGQQDVGRLHVAMDHPTSVRRAQRIHDLPEEPRRLGRRKRPFLLEPGSGSTSTGTSAWSRPATCYPRSCSMSSDPREPTT